MARKGGFYVKDKTGKLIKSTTPKPDPQKDQAAVTRASNTKPLKAGEGPKNDH